MKGPGPSVGNTQSKTPPSPQTLPSSPKHETEQIIHVKSARSLVVPRFFSHWSLKGTENYVHF